MSSDNETYGNLPYLLEFGELVIMRDGQRAVIERVVPGEDEPYYVVRFADGSERTVEADGLIRASVYARRMSPQSDWRGEERREGERRMAERRSHERATPGRRLAERRQ